MVLGLHGIRTDPSAEVKRKDSETQSLLHRTSPLPSSDAKPADDYQRETIYSIVRTRAAWLLLFCGGLMLAALVVEHFQTILEKHVQLSFFVPLIMGHAGNTGSQTCATIVRALALKQVTPRDWVSVLFKESVAGAAMGALIGVVIMIFSSFWHGLAPGVAAVAAFALPIVSCWANMLATILTLASERYGLDPALISAPLVTTILDATGLGVYFYLAEIILDLDLHALHGAKAAPVAAAGRMAARAMLRLGQ